MRQGTIAALVRFAVNVYGPGPGYVPQDVITPLLASGGTGNAGVGAVGLAPQAQAVRTTPKAGRGVGLKPLGQ